MSREREVKLESFKIKPRIQIMIPYCNVFYRFVYVLFFKDKVTKVGTDVFIFTKTDQQNVTCKEIRFLQPPAGCSVLILLSRLRKYF